MTTASTSTRPKRFTIPWLQKNDRLRGIILSRESSDTERWNALKDLEWQMRSAGIEQARLNRMRPHA